MLAFAGVVDGVCIVVVVVCIVASTGVAGRVAGDEAFCSPVEDTVREVSKEEVDLKAREESVMTLVLIVEEDREELDSIFLN